MSAGPQSTPGRLWEERATLAEEERDAAHRLAESAENQVERLREEIYRLRDLEPFVQFVAWLDKPQCCKITLERLIEKAKRALGHPPAPEQFREEWRVNGKLVVQTQEDAEMLAIKLRPPDSEPNHIEHRYRTEWERVESEQGGACAGGVSTGPIPSKDIDRAQEFVRERGWTDSAVKEEK